MVCWRSGRSRGPIVESSASCVEPSKQIVGGQHLEPRRRELERERQRVEAPADRGDGSGVGRCQLKIRAHVPDARHEQPYSWRALEIGRRHRIAASFERERSDGVLAFAPEAERRAAGREHAKRGDRRQQIGDERRRVQHLLEVVEHQQRRLIGAGEAGEPGKSSAVTSDSPSASAIADATNGDLANRGQRDEHHTGRAFGRDGVRQLQRQPRLAGAARPRERDEARGWIGKPLAQRVDVGVSTHEGGWRQRERDIAQLDGGCP